MKLSLKHESWFSYGGFAILAKYREVSPREREAIRAASADATALAAARASDDMDKLPEDLKGAEEKIEDAGTRLVAGCVMGLHVSKLETDENGKERRVGKHRPLKLDYYNGDGNLHEGTWNDMDDPDDSTKVYVLRSHPKLTEYLTGLLLHSESPMLLGK